MARSKSQGRGSALRRGSLTRLLAAFVLGVITTLAGLVAYLYFGRPPVAATENPALWEPLLSLPNNVRARRAAKPPPFPASEEACEAAAHTYRAQRAQCHGVSGHDAALGKSMVPRAQQFFSTRDRAATVAQQPGEIYWKTAFGIRRSGMSAFGRALTDTQLWQLALMLHSANDLPDPVRGILTQGLPPPQPSVLQP